MVLNIGPLNWESSTLTTRPLFHNDSGVKHDIDNDLMQLYPVISLQTIFTTYSG